MHDELLIESVRSNRVLYDFSHPKYWDSEHKNKLWNQIGKKLNTNGTTCRSRWHNIRDQYRKTLKKTIAKRGQNAKKIPYYKYHELMSFMDGFFQEREKKDVMTADDEDDFYGTQLKTDNEDASSNSSRPGSSIETFPHAMVSVESPINATLHSSAQGRHPLSPDRPSSPKASGSTSSQDKKDISRLTSTAAYLVEYIIKKSEKKPEHPVDKFLEGIAPTLRSLTPYYQNLAKSEIFATVQRYEMMMLKETQDLSNKELKETRGQNSSRLDIRDSVEKKKEK